MSKRAVLVSWALLAIVVAGAFAVGVRGSSPPHSTEERVYRISATLKCPQCVGESVAQSDAAISREIRQRIAELIPKGYSDDQIRDRIAANYDAEIRTTPTRSGVTGLVWMLPVVVGVLALAGLVVVFRKWSRAERLHASDEDRELVASAIGDGHAG